MIRRAIGRVLLWFAEPILRDRAFLAERLRPHFYQHPLIFLHPDPVENRRQIDAIEACLRGGPGRDAPR